MASKIILCGFGRAGKEALNKLLLECGNSDIFVFATRDKRDKDFLKFVKYNNIKFSTEKINDCLGIIKREKPKYLLSIYYPYIINDKILKQVQFRAINLHPSLLPKYKGCFSAPWTIISNEEYSGITYHYMTSEVDQGNIILQKKVKVADDDSGFSLYHKLITLGINNFDAAFKKLRSGYKGRKQKKSGNYRTYKREVPYNGYIDTNWTKNKIYNFIRAMYFPPFKGARLKYKRKKIEFLHVDEFDKFVRKNKIKIKK